MATKAGEEGGSNASVFRRQKLIKNDQATGVCPAICVNIGLLRIFGDPITELNHKLKALL